MLWLLLGRGYGCLAHQFGGHPIGIYNDILGFRVLDVLCVLDLRGCLDEMTEESTYSCQKREYGNPHPAVQGVQFLQAQKHVSRQKPWHDMPFQVDFAPRSEIRTIAVLHFACEQDTGSTR